MTSKERQTLAISEHVNSLEIRSDWLTRRQACAYIQIGISTLDKNLSIKKYYLGKSVRYNRNDLDAYLFENCVEPNKEDIKSGK